MSYTEDQVSRWWDEAASAQARYLLVTWQPDCPETVKVMACADAEILSALTEEARASFRLVRRYDLHEDKAEEIAAAARMS